MNIKKWNPDKRIASAGWNEEVTKIPKKVFRYFNKGNVWYWKKADSYVIYVPCLSSGDYWCISKDYFDNYRMIY